MPLVTLDGHSLMIDGRRIWLVSGTLHPARIPRGLWPQRIDAAKRAGLNCICVDAFWSVHEPSPGKFHFNDEADLAHFISLIAEHDMFCILRPGPHLGGGWDGGGIPRWLLADPSVALRSTSREQPRFLEATGRYFSTLMEQVSRLQATSADGGPIVLMQAEREWFCDPPPSKSAGYLEELVRHLREHGCQVPITMANNMWTRVDGTIDTWNAHEHLAADLRQISLVQPEAPRIVSEFTCAPPRSLSDTTPALTPSACLGKMAEVLAAGAQYNLHMFHGGTNFAFQAGTAEPGLGHTSAHAPDAPLAEGGHAGTLLPAVKSISTFASQFAHVLAHLHEGDFRAAAAPFGPSHPPSVLHQRGTRGDVVFIIRPESDRSTTFDLLLPNGLTLPVPMGRDTVAWVLLNANLGPIELNYSSLRPWACVAQQILVFFGPAGMTGHLALNDAPMTVSVPTGQRPLVEHHEETTIVVLNHAQMNATTLLDDGLIVGADGLDDGGEPRPHGNWRTATRIDRHGTRSTVRLLRPGRLPTPRLTAWQHADTTAFLDGTSTQYAEIDGPCTLDAAGCPTGYGWYRIDFPKTWSGQALPAGASDRAHVFRESCLEKILGPGPGADDGPCRFKATGRITILVDNLGRTASGAFRIEQKGMHDHLYGVKPVRLGRTGATTTVPDPFVLGGYLHGVRAGDTAEAGSHAWRVAASGSLPLILDIGVLPARCMLLVNGVALGICLPGAAGGRFVLHSGEQLRRRSNEIQLAFFDERPPADVVTKAVRLYQATRNLTGSATWSFAAWHPPSDKAFGPMPEKFGRVPRWYRCQIPPIPNPTPLWLDVAPLSKGQLFLNGRNLCRYFVQTVTRRSVDARKRCYLPEPWLHPDKPNTVMIFDEHGFRPTGCRVCRSDR